MNKFKFIIIRAIFVYSIVILMSGCVIMSESYSVPRATYSLLIPKQVTRVQVLEQIHHSLNTLGFSLSENDWENWKSILDAKHLAEKKEERRYKRGQFEIVYGVLYRPIKPESIQLEFYQHESRQFTQDGIRLYGVIVQAFVKNGLQLVGHQMSSTPQQFNAANPFPAVSNTIKVILLLLLAIAVYIVIILLPAWLLVRKLLSKFTLGVLTKRLIITFVSALLFFPAPVFLSMFGPTLLVPGVLVIQSIIDAPERYNSFVIFSILGTSIVSGLVSFRIIKK